MAGVRSEYGLPWSLLLDPNSGFSISVQVQREQDSRAGRGTGAREPVGSAAENETSQRDTSWGQGLKRLCMMGVSHLVRERLFREQKQGVDFWGQ